MVCYIYRMIRISLRNALASLSNLLSSIILISVKMGLFLLTWKFFFQKYSLVRGWGFEDMLAMTGIVMVSEGFVHAFLNGIRDLPSLIETGQLDLFLVQPRNTLLNLSLCKSNLNGFAEIIVGGVLLGVSGYFFTKAFALLWILPLGVCFMYTLHMYLGSLCFFIQNSSSFIKELVQNACIIATQPNSAFTGFIRILTLTVLPVAFLSYFPIEYLRTNTRENAVYAFLGTFLFFILASFVFQRGVKRYESSSLTLPRH